MYYYITISLLVLGFVAGVDQVINDVLHCQPVTSCSKRCNIEEAHQYFDPSVGAFVIPSYTCFCDPLCRLYGDCCVDYEDICTDSGTKVKKLQMQVAQANDTQVNIEPVNPQKGVPPPPHNSRSMFECITIKEYPHRAFWSTSKCHHSWINSEAARLCSNVTEADLLSRLPVQSDDGLTYRNVFCAQCNGRVNVTFWRTDARCRAVPPENASSDPYALAVYLKEDCKTFFTTERESPPRYCLNVENTCDHSKHDTTKNFTKLARACVDGYQSPVIGRKQGEFGKIFKNSYCSECNGFDIQREYCPSSRNKKIDDIKENKFLNKSDYDYSVITNFNTRESDHLVILYRTTGNVVPVEIQCPDGKVYDPYSEACREIYCGESYMLVGDECVENRQPQDFIKCNNILTCDHSPTIPNDMTSNSTEVTFRLTIVIRFEIKLSGNYPKLDDLTNFQLLQDNFNISVKNITMENKYFWDGFQNSSTANSTLEFTKTNVTVSGTAIIYVTQTAANNREELNIAITAILSSIAQSVDIYDVTVYVDSTAVEFPNKEQNNVELDNLDGFNNFLNECQSGVVRVYCDYDVTYIQQNDCQSVFVNSTGTEYSCSDSFIYINENFTSQQDYTVFVCDHVHNMNDSCRRVRYNETEYIFLDDGSVYVADGSVYEKGNYLKVENGQVEVCTEFQKVKNVYYVVFFDFNDVQKYTAFICISISIVGLFFTIVTYSCLDELRTIPGLCIISLASTTMLSQFIFLLGINNTGNSLLCASVAVLLHYLFLSCSLWTNVMAYDVYNTFGKKRITRREQRPTRTFRKYCAYAWGIPLVIVVVCVTLYITNHNMLGYGDYYSCWISKPLGFLLAFLVPLMVILLVNLALFVKTIYVMRVNRRSKHLNREGRGIPNDRSEVTVYVKMSTVMGFAWVFGCIAAFTDTNALWYFFIVFNGLQGLFIYISFACNTRVRKLLRDRYTKFKKGRRESAHSSKSRFSVSVEGSTVSKSLSETEMNLENFEMEVEHFGDPFKLDVGLHPSEMMSNC